MLIDEDEDLGEFEAEIRSDGVVLCVMTRLRENLIGGLERRHDPARAKRVGVAVGQVEEKIHAKAARARALEEPCCQLDEGEAQRRWEVCGGEVGETLPAGSSTTRMRRKVIWRTGRKESFWRVFSSASQAQSRSVSGPSMSSVYPSLGCSAGTMG